MPIPVICVASTVTPFVAVALDLSLIHIYIMLSFRAVKYRNDFFQYPCFKLA